MGKIFAAIDDRLRAWIEAQHLFVVATAPSGDGGHVNASPKGLDALRFISPTAVAYLDYNGSGAETIAHLRDNGRIVLLFNAFDGPPRILRLHGHGRVIEPQDAEYAALRGLFAATETPTRAIIYVDLTRISDSCGFGVPLYDYAGQRPHLDESGRKKGVEGLRIYQREKNARSIDGLPALRWVTEDASKE